MGHFYNPPPPFVGGAQPHAPHALNPSAEAVAVNNPPPTHPGRIPVMAETIALWQPPDPNPMLGGRQPLEPRKLSPQLTAVVVNDPPYTHPGRIPVTAEIVALSQPPDPNPMIGGRQPLEPRKLNPQLIAVRVDQPPIPIPESVLLAVDAAWRSDPVPTQVVQRIVTGAVAGSQVIPTPENAFAVIDAAWRQEPAPLLPRKNAPGIPGSSVDAPPIPVPENLFAVIDAAWRQDPAPTIPGKLNASFEAVAVNNPPIPVPENYIVASWLAWIPPDPSPTLPRNLGPGIPGQSVDNPPPPLTMTVVLLPPDPLPQTTRPLVQAGAPAARVPFTPNWLMTVLASWTPADPAPQKAMTLNASFEAVRVDQPPVPTPEPMLTVIDAWWRQDVAPVVGRPSAATVPAPVASLPRAPAFVPTVAWLLPDPVPQTAGRLNPAVEAVRVDAPSPSSVAAMAAVYAMWNAPLPPPTIVNARLIPGTITLTANPKYIIGYSKRPIRKLPQ